VTSTHEETWSGDGDGEAVTCKSHGDSQNYRINVGRSTKPNDAGENWTA